MELTDRNEIPDSPGMPPIIKKIGLIIVGAIAIFVAVAIYFHEGPDLEKIAAFELEQELDASGEDDHETLRYPEDRKGTVAPKFQEPRDGDDYEQQTAIGFVVNQKPFAMLLNPVEEKHVLLANAVLEGTGVVVTHNYSLNISRVLKQENMNEPPDVRLGGWEFLRGLVLLHKNVRYKQLSKKIPFDDLEFEVGSLADWLAKHPTTLISYSEENMENNLMGNWPENDPNHSWP